MEKLKRILRRVFCHGAATVALCIIAATAALVWAFAVAPEGHPLVYAAYVFSAYALTLLCVNVAHLREGSKPGCRATGMSAAIWQIYLSK